MSELLKFKSDEGHSILVEVDGDQGGRIVRGGRATDAVIEASSSLDQALAGLGPAVKSILTQLRAGAEWPDELEIEFGVTLSADANVIIARTTGQANFRIAMTWTGQGRPAAAD
ncbi:MAG: CU044_2847 family protein [Solirubrobacteraceae bacterium]